MIRNSVLTGGTYITQINHGPSHTSLRILKDASSPRAFHNSRDRYDAPKCHENTRVAVLKTIMDWVTGCDPETRDRWIMWLSGGAGAGKSAIGQTFAEQCDREGRLLASFFFGRSDPTRNNAKFLIPTIACQVYEKIPEARINILSAIDNDPMLFEKAFLIQLLSLVIEPLKRLGDAVPPNVIVIDGLDECMDIGSQTAILHTLFEAVQKHCCGIRFLVASRPEHDIATTISLQDNTVLARLVLDDGYRPNRDIRYFLNYKIQSIKETHPFRHLLPQEWPEDEHVDEVVRKSSGQFIYVSTVIRYIESNRHRPDHRLEIVRNLRPHQGDLPFAELDALYTHILTAVKDISTIVELLGFVLYATQVYKDLPTAYVEACHDLERGSLQLILCDLGALVEINKDGIIKVLHASLLDFLLDPSRSKKLPISGSELITKHITRCFRFFSKNKFVYDLSISFFVGFLSRYLGHVILFTTDMAQALAGFSLFDFCRQTAIPLDTRNTFLKRVNPVLIELIRRSDQHHLLSWYLNMLDESYLALMDQYPPQTLALQISVMMHYDILPRLALYLPFQLPGFQEEDNILAILSFRDYSKNLGPTRAHRNFLRKFLLDPARSKHHNFQDTAPTIYATALLGCFRYLKKVTVSHELSINETWLDKCQDDTDDTRSTKTGSTGEYNQASAQGHQGRLSTTEGQVDSKTDHPQTVHTNLKRDKGQYTARRAEELHNKVDTERDFQTWYQDWTRNFGPEVPDWKVFWRYSNELQAIRRLSSPEDYQEVLRVRYYLMLGYMIFFFPRAGKFEELITLCETTILRRDPRLFPENTASAQRAMVAYLNRISGTTEKNHTRFSEPSVSFKIPSEILAHNSQERCEISPNAHMNAIVKSPPSTIHQNSVSRNTITNYAGKKNESRMSPAPAQSVSLDGRHSLPIRIPAKRGLELLTGPNINPTAKRPEKK